METVGSKKHDVFWQFLNCQGFTFDLLLKMLLSDNTAIDHFLKNKTFCIDAITEFDLLTKYRNQNSLNRASMRCSPSHEYRYRDSKCKRNPRDAIIMNNQSAFTLNWCFWTRNLFSQNVSEEEECVRNSNNSDRKKWSDERPTQTVISNIWRFAIACRWRFNLKRHLRVIFQANLFWMIYFASQTQSFVLAAIFVKN